MDYGHWNVNAVGEFDPGEFFGFIYEIVERSTGRAYIGKKFFRHKKKKTKKDPSSHKESNWRIYTSSSDLLNEAIKEKGKDAFDFYILILCVGKCQLTYEENRMQFARDVLRAKLPDGTRKYYNKTIGHLIFGGLEKQSEEAKRKIAAANMGNKNALGVVRSPETREKMGAAKRGVPKSSEHRAKLAAVNLGKKQSQETKDKKNAAISRLRWWNNGTIQKRAAEQPGPEWARGRLKSSVVG